MVSAEASLRELGIQLPQAPTPFGAYVEGVQTGDLLFFSGNAPCRKPEAKIRWEHRQGTGRRGRPGSGIRRGSEYLGRCQAEVGRRIGSFFKAMEARVADALCRAKTAGELADGVEPSSAARILVCFVEGLRVVGKTAPTRITSQATVDALLDRFTR
jgi:hypothetical protein